MVTDAEILAAETVGRSATTVEEAVTAFATVMRLICEQDDKNSGTDSRNQHWAAKAMTATLGSLVDMSAIDSAYSAMIDRKEEDGPSKKLYEKYWFAMDASNLSGVVLSMQRDLDSIAIAAKAAQENLSKSPIMICLVDKFRQLTRS